MFTLLKRKILAQTAVEDPIEASKAVPTQQFQETDTDFLKDYRRVAEKLGVAVRSPGSLTPFKTWLSTEGVPCYSEDKVKTYLNKMLGKNNTDYTHTSQYWLWRGARVNDTIIYNTKYAGAPVGLTSLKYSKPLPYPVMLTMERIQGAFPNAGFYISDTYTDNEKAAMRDPFLLVIVGDERYIVERWDEPNFRDRHVAK